MPTSPSPSPSRDFDTNELRSLIAQDLAASNELAARITQLRQDIEDGKSLPPKKVALMEQSNKDMTKDLVARVEKIERAANLDAADREMLQVLNVRLAVCDLQTMRLAELRDLELIARGTKKKVFLDAKAGPSATVEPEEELSPGHGPVRKTEEDEDFVFVSQEEDAESSFDGSNLDEEKAGSEYSDEPQIDKSGWPLLYRIMNVDPDTMAMDMERLLKASHKKLALKHSPQYLPNDPAAPALWEKISKAYNVLADPDKRNYYDMHENVPDELKDFDVCMIEKN